MMSYRDRETLASSSRLGDSWSRRRAEEEGAGGGEARRDMSHVKIGLFWGDREFERGHEGAGVTACIVQL